MCADHAVADALFEELAKFSDGAKLATKPLAEYFEQFVFELWMVAKQSMKVLAHLGGEFDRMLAELIHVVVLLEQALFVVVAPR